MCRRQTDLDDSDLPSYIALYLRLEFTMCNLAYSKSSLSSLYFTAQTTIILIPTNDPHNFKDRLKISDASDAIAFIHCRRSVKLIDHQGS